MIKQLETKEGKKDKGTESLAEFVPEFDSKMKPEEKWDLVFENWINKIEQKKMIVSLLELKFWFESLEEFFTSSYLEELIFQYQSSTLRNYEFYVFTFARICGKIINHLKDLDFEKDKYLVNFEEFIVERILERYTTGTFPYLQDVYSPESWFYSLRIFLQSLKNLTSELVKNELITQRAFSSLKKLYHKELMNNSIIIALLKRRFIAKIDKINEKRITDIISSIKERKLKNHIGIFFIFSFRIMKLNKFIELILNKSRHYNITIPLILALKKNIENMFTFYETMLKKSLDNNIKNDKELLRIGNAFRDLKFEYKKIYDREFPYYFDTTSEKINRRKLLKNIVIISDFAIQELVENIAKIFKPEFSGGDIFKNYISRKKKSLDVKKKLIILHTRINDYFSAKGRISPADIFYDINLFIETDLNYLLYKDWNAFLNHYNNLVKTDFSSEFDINLKSFHSFITEILKEIINKKK